MMTEWKTYYIVYCEVYCEYWKYKKMLKAVLTLDRVWAGGVAGLSCHFLYLSSRPVRRLVPGHLRRGSLCSSWGWWQPLVLSGAHRPSSQPPEGPACPHSCGWGSQPPHVCSFSTFTPFTSTTMSSSSNPALYAAPLFHHLRETSWTGYCTPKWKSVIQPYVLDEYYMFIRLHTRPNL